MDKRRTAYRLALLSILTASSTLVSSLLLAPTLAILCGSVANISCLLVLAFLLGDGKDVGGG